MKVYFEDKDKAQLTHQEIFLMCKKLEDIGLRVDTFKIIDYDKILDIQSKCVVDPEDEQAGLDSIKEESDQYGCFGLSFARIDSLALRFVVMNALACKHGMFILDTDTEIVYDNHYFIVPLHKQIHKIKHKTLTESFEFVGRTRLRGKIDTLIQKCCKLRKNICQTCIENDYRYMDNLINYSIYCYKDKIRVELTLDTYCCKDHKKNYVEMLK